MMYKNEPFFRFGYLIKYFHFDYSTLKYLLKQRDKRRTIIHGKYSYRENYFKPYSNYTDKELADTWNTMEYEGLLEELLPGEKIMDTVQRLRQRDIQKYLDARNDI